MLVTFLLGNGHSTESARAWRQASSESEPLPACSGVRSGSAPRAPAAFPPGAGAGPPQPHPRVLPASGTHHFHRCPEGQCGTQTFAPEPPPAQLGRHSCVWDGVSFLPV